jgi:hypothetical protein
MVACSIEAKVSLQMAKVTRIMKLGTKSTAWAVQFAEK